jgi:hypothetical protein
MFSEQSFRGHLDNPRIQGTGNLTEIAGPGKCLAAEFQSESFQETDFAPESS